jgi:hypothetical protein
LSFGGELTGLSRCRYGTTSTSISSFFGYCYFCDYSRHSQNHCPLRKCRECRNYGHSEKVCPELKKKLYSWRNPQNISTQTWRYKQKPTTAWPRSVPVTTKKSIANEVSVPATFE